MTQRVSGSLFRRRYTEPGAPPGALRHDGLGGEVRVRLTDYDAEQYEEVEIRDLDGIAARVGRDSVTWIDVQGLGDGSVVQRLGQILNLHPLACADVVNVGQPPKVESYENSLFVVLRMVTLEGSGQIQWEQVSLFLGQGFVLTFQEKPGDCLDRLRGRLREGRRRVRSSGCDYLAIMIIDSIVDGYFPAVETYGERLEDLEREILSQSAGSVLKDTYRIRRELVIFRRAITPLREALGRLMRDPDAPIGTQVALYLRDTADHVAEVAGIVESYQELGAGVSEFHLNRVNLRMNEVMRTLTIVATLFIPLTFLAGIYGMNFDTAQPANMPELGWKYGYVAFWVVSLLLTATLLGLFRRAGWLGSRGASRVKARRPRP